MTLAQRIRQARRQGKLSQKALAALVGVQRSAVSNWESVNSVQPAMATMIAISNATNVSLEWLATGQGKMQAAQDIDAGIPGTDAEHAGAPYEPDLLRAFRGMPQRSQILLLELAEALVSTRRTRRASAKTK